MAEQGQLINTKVATHGLKIVHETRGVQCGCIREQCRSARIALVDEHQRVMRRQREEIGNEIVRAESRATVHYEDRITASTDDAIVKPNAIGHGEEPVRRTQLDDRRRRKLRVNGRS
jgi:hypothetical protein